MMAERAIRKVESIVQTCSFNLVQSSFLPERISLFFADKGLANQAAQEQLEATVFLVGIRMKCQLVTKCLKSFTSERPLEYLSTKCSLSQKCIINILLDMT